MGRELPPFWDVTMTSDHSCCSSQDRARDVVARPWWGPWEGLASPSLPLPPALLAEPISWVVKLLWPP